VDAKTFRIRCGYGGFHVGINLGSLAFLRPVDARPIKTRTEDGHGIRRSLLAAIEDRDGFDFLYRPRPMARQPAAGARAEPRL
jgi:hypothetical protein